MQHHHNRAGYLEITVGPMWAGKTTSLLNLQNKFNLLKYNILTINWVNSAQDEIVINHDNKTGTALRLKHLTTIYDLEIYDKAEKILIDEAQFFDDLFDFVVRSVDQKKKEVYLFGLDGDFRRKPFGDIPKLYPFADKFTKLNAICMICAEKGVEMPGLFTQRTVTNDEQVLIGGEDKYRCVCRYHFLNQDKTAFVK